MFTKLWYCDQDGNFKSYSEEQVLNYFIWNSVCGSSTAERQTFVNVEIYEKRNVYKDTSSLGAA